MVGREPNVLDRSLSIRITNRRGSLTSTRIKIVNILSAMVILAVEAGRTVAYSPGNPHDLALHAVGASNCVYQLLLLGLRCYKDIITVVVHLAQSLRVPTQFLSRPDFRPSSIQRGISVYIESTSTLGQVP